jgi:hypothetical protein
MRTSSSTAVRTFKDATSRCRVAPTSEDTPHLSECHVQARKEHHAKSGQYAIEWGVVEFKALGVHYKYICRKAASHDLAPSGVHRRRLRVGVPTIACSAMLNGVSFLSASAIYD